MPYFFSENGHAIYKGRHGQHMEIGRLVVDNSVSTAVRAFDNDAWRGWCGDKNITGRSVLRKCIINKQQ